MSDQFVPATAKRRRIMDRGLKSTLLLAALACLAGLIGLPLAGAHPLIKWILALLVGLAGGWVIWLLAEGNREEPFLRVVKRDRIGIWKKITVRLGAIVLALLVDALFILCVTGLNPIDVYVTMYQGTFRTNRLIMASLRDWAPLLLISIALAPAFKMRFWNVGGEGQVLMGALGSALVMVYVPQAVNAMFAPETAASLLNGPMIYLLMLLASMVLGALWGFIPAVFKANFGTNETLFTLMMNYVAIKIVSSFFNLWRGQASALGQLNMTTKVGWFHGTMVLGVRNVTYLSTIIFALVMMILMFCYLRYTKHGYEISVVGESQRTAQYAGISVKKVTIRTMIISGILCGIVGFLIVGGKDQTISTATAEGNGFTAIIVAWMAKFNAFYMALISAFLIFLEHGSQEITNAYQIMNKYAADIITGVILFFIIGSEFFINYRLVFRSVHKEVR